MQSTFLEAKQGFSLAAKLASPVSFDDYQKTCLILQKSCLHGSDNLDKVLNFTNHLEKSLKKFRSLKST